MKFIFDRVLGGKHRPKGPSLAAQEGLDASALIGLAVLAFVLITALQAVAAFVSTAGFARVGNRLLTEVRGEVYGHLQRLSLSFHSRARGGELVLRVLGDVNLLKDVAVTSLLPLLANVLVLLVMFGVMFWLNAKLALVALLSLPVFGLWTVRLGRRIRRAARDQRKSDAAMAATATETVGAIKIVQALGLERLFAENFDRRNRESLREDLRGTRLTSALGRATGFLVAAASAVVLGYGARLVLVGELSPGELLVFMAYLRSALRPVQDFAKHTGRLAKATVAGERVFDLLEQVPEVRDLPGAVPAPRSAGGCASRT
jgi:ATP-binding cassette subfamily B protein